MPRPPAAWNAAKFARLCVREYVCQGIEDEVDHALDLLGVLAGVRDAQNPAARLPADHHAGRVDEGHREDRAHRGFDVAQRSIRSGDRQHRIARVAQGAIRREALVVSSLGARAPRRAGITTAQPRATKNRATSGKSSGRVNAAGFVPVPVEPWLKTRVGAGAAVVGS